MPIFGKPAVARLRPGRLDVFVRSREGTLGHVWMEGGTSGSLDLGGGVDEFTEPVVVQREPAGLEVFAIGGLRLLHWRWDEGRGRMVGPETLPGFVTWGMSGPEVAPVGPTPPPMAVADGDTLYVFGSAIEGALRMWRSVQAGPWTLDTVNHVTTGSDLVALRREPGIIDVYSNSFGIEHWAFDHGQWSDMVRLPGPAIAATGIAAIAATAGPDPQGVIRQDVYGRTRDGNVFHWGKGGFFGGGAPGMDPVTHWFGPDPTLPNPGVAFGVTAVPDGPDIFFRDANQTLHHWRWNQHTRKYDDLTAAVTVGAGWPADPVALTRVSDVPGTSGIDVVARVSETVVRAASVIQGQWSQQTANLPKPRDAAGPELIEPAPDPLDSDDDAPPTYLVVRPADHVVLGVRAPGYRLDTEQAPRLIAEDPDAHLVVTFPPQHVAEEVSKPNELPINGSVWQAKLAGSTRVAFTAAAEITLTAADLLAALDGAAVDPDDQRSAIELPWGLILSPLARDGQQVITRHPAQPLNFTGTTGIWRTRLGTAAGDGDLDIQSRVPTGRTDPFPVALTKANRMNIAGQTPAKARLLELSSLGGSLTATGRWPTLEWDHQAVGGRDQRVRTATKGVLYPLGHRAVFVETTERSDTENVAVLRKTRNLYITEALRTRPGTDADALARTFPFTEMEILALEYPNLDNAVWQTVPRITEQIVTLQNELAQAQAEALGIWLTLFSVHDFDMGGFPSIEDLADGIGDDAGELIDPDDPQGPTRASAARSWLDSNAGVEGLARAIEILQNEHLDTEQVDTYFEPMLDGARVRFPVRLRGANGDVLFELPLLFVADLQLTDSARAPFRSLSDPQVAEQIHDFYTQAGGGVVDVGGTQIDMAPAESGYRQEVYRLNIVGNPGSGGGFAPSLGRAGDAASWAADVGLPTMRALLGSDPRARVAFDAAFVGGAPSDVPLRILGKLGNLDEITDLAVEFTANTDRSGALAAPNFIADGISRIKGLVNVAGMQSQIIDAGVPTLDPAKLFSDGASLLGFDLRDLVTNISTPPEVVTIHTDGAPPEVRLTWNDIDLKPSLDGSFVPQGPSSKFSLTVRSNPDVNETTCTITDFKLVMPPGNAAIIEIQFGQVQFRQTAGRPPELTVDGLSANFVGTLALLQTLQDKVGLGGLGPQVVPTSSAISARYSVPVPDVSALAFVMSNLVFDAALTVPYNGDPISMAIAFGSRERPFTLTVLMFGGGGYLDLAVDHTGLQRLEISLQFGAAIAMNFGVASAEVHAFGGIRFVLVNGSVSLTGYLHIGGSVDLLGLVSVSVELQVELEYQFDTNALVGRAKIVVELDTALFSDSIELDSGNWVIAGGTPHAVAPPAAPAPALFAAPAGPDEAGLQAWRAYRGAFQ